MPQKSRRFNYISLICYFVYINLFSYFVKNDGCDPLLLAAPGCSRARLVSNKFSLLLWEPSPLASFSLYLREEAEVGLEARVWAPAPGMEATATALGTAMW